MANLRSVNTYFWVDTYIADLPTAEKLLFVYLITNPLVTLAGCYEISLKQIAFDTDIDRTDVSEMLAKFERDGKIIYRDNWMVLKNFLFHQSFNENMRINVRTVLADTPDWVKLTIAAIMESSESLAKGFEGFIKGLRMVREDEVEDEVEVEKEDEVENKAAPTTTRKPKLTDAEWLESLKSKEAYKGLNVAAEYEKAQVWAEAHNRECTRRFFVGWINRATPSENVSPKLDNYDSTKDLLSPDFVNERPRMDFEQAADMYFNGHHNDGTREKYEGMKRNWLTTAWGKGYEHEIDEYECRTKFKQRFNEAGSLALGV